MKLTSVVRNTVCQTYKKEYTRLIKSFMRLDNHLPPKAWNDLSKSFFCANWIGLYWFLIEHQTSVKPHKKISKETFGILAKNEFGAILAHIFDQNFRLNKIDGLLNWEVKQITNYVDCSQLYGYLDQHRNVLNETLLAFMRQITPWLVTFSVYDLFISKMKFIFDYPSDQKFIYEQNVCLLQKQIGLLCNIQKLIQNLDSFILRNDAIILVTTLRKDVWDKKSSSWWWIL